MEAAEPALPAVLFSGEARSDIVAMENSNWKISNSLILIVSGYFLSTNTNVQSQRTSKVYGLIYACVRTVLYFLKNTSLFLFLLYINNQETAPVSVG